MERVFSWEVTIGAVLGLAGLGLAFLALKDFKLAKLFFLLTAADAIGGIAMEGAKSRWPAPITSVAVIVLGGAVAFLTLLSFRYVDRKQELEEKRPTVKATISTRMLGRLYMRGVIPPPGQKVEAFPQFQEIFYEWSISLTADRQSIASLKADWLQANDVFRVEPEGANAERVPESPLGFKTPGKPSHYALIVKSDDLADTQPLTITIRRSVTVPLVDGDSIKLAYVRSSTSKVEQSVYDPKTDVERLKYQAKILAQWIYPPKTSPLPLHPPGPIPLGWQQSILEVWCKDAQCKEMMAGNLVAEWNRISP